MLLVVGLLDQVIAGGYVAPYAERHAHQAMLELQRVLHIDWQRAQLFDLRHQRGAVLRELHHHGFTVVRDAGNLAAANCAADELIVAAAGTLTGDRNRHGAIEEIDRRYLHILRGVAAAIAAYDRSHLRMDFFERRRWHRQLDGKGHGAAAYILLRLVPNAAVLS